MNAAADAHRRHVATAGLELHRRVLDAADGGADEVVGALERLRELRTAVDRAELELLVAARGRQRVSWARVAVALGLRSRQAAEQRAARLTEQLGSLSAGGCQFCVDTPAVAELRAAARTAAGELAADPSWDGAHPRAALARSGLATAADAPPGPLYALVEHALADLSGVDLVARPVLLRVAVGRLREAFAAAAPAAAEAPPRPRRPH
ncbi:hypothetical protein ACFQY4_11640 [Catellatospora bangladeshensis]|uniref:Uncharacterized protein n=1 Tax=Catellatospora bangladeshensis TaxID=310355 RepID=A0A8J3JFV8_9ACTN|nr:hypothetical protein [Catellatospora bangladeshensis]GIF81899.1 hypothetical protein Cba03nite_32480 [Catellatospora bangladeshensis]